MQTKGIIGYNITSLQFSLFGSLLFHMLVYNNMGRFGTKMNMFCQLIYEHIS